MATVLRNPTDDEVAGYAGMDGIGYLVAVTQMKASDANAAALSGAESQARKVTAGPPSGGSKT